MGWLQKIFGGDAKPPVAHSDQAMCIKLAGAYVIDLRPLPHDRARVIAAIGTIAARIEAAPEPLQVWIVSTALLEAFDESTDTLMELTDALFAATKRVQPKMIVEKDAPEAAVYILRSLGFEVFLPGLKLTTDDGGEIDVLAEIERIKRAPRIQS
jgi:hypothetical protein